MKIIQIDPSNESFAQALGITPDREEELDALIGADMDRMFEHGLKNESISEQLERLTSYCRTPNETAYVCFQTGAFAGKMAVADVVGAGTLEMLYRMAELRKGGHDDNA